MTRWAMVVEQDRCIGCWACAIACKVENSVSLDLWWQRVLTVDGVVTPTSDLGLDGPVADISTATNPVKTYLPVQCQHCERPDCAAACPTDAITRRADGIVVIDEAACIGCGYCTVACPYDAISLNDGPPRFPSGLEAGHGSAAVAPRSSGVAEKCTFCVHRVDVGVEPACVEACPTQVLFFGDLDDHERGRQAIGDARCPSAEGRPRPRPPCAISTSDHGRHPASQPGASGQVTAAPDPSGRASAALAALATERAAAWRELAGSSAIDRDRVVHRLASPRERRAADVLLDPLRPLRAIAIAVLVANLAEQEAAAWIEDAATARLLRRQQQPHIDALAAHCVL